MIGKTVSHYKITRELGAGGMGVVYEAVDTKLDRSVALKFLPPESTRDPDAKARFVHEAKAASAIDHPNVCNIYEIDETDDGQLFLAMARYKGETLKERIARGQIPLDDALNIISQVAEGLNEAHARDIVHRDIKPANLFITEGGLVKILDFGLAKLSGMTQLTKTGTTFGTCYYMSPEQAAGRKMDTRTDLWSVGVILYEMIAGRVPFQGDHAQAVLYGIQNNKPEPISTLRKGIPPGLEGVIGKCLAKDPESRWQTVENLRLSLLEFFPPSAQSSTDILTMNLARKNPPNYWVRSVAVFLVALVIVAIVVSALSLDLLRMGENSPKFTARRLTMDAGLEIDPALSPDGKMMAYSGGSPGAMRIKIQRLSGGTPVTLTDDPPGDHRWPRWSADGENILFSVCEMAGVVGQESTRRGNCYMVSSLGGMVRKITIPTGNRLIWGTNWLADGTEVIYTNGDSILVFDQEGQTTKTIWGREMASHKGVGGMSVSHDGNQIAFDLGNPGFLAALGLNVVSSDIWVAGMESGLGSPVISDGFLNMFPRWSENGKSLFFVSSRGGFRDLYRSDVNDKGVGLRRVSRLTTGMSLYTFDVSLDGDVILLSNLLQSGNIWAVPITSGRAVSGEPEQVTFGDHQVEGKSISDDHQWLAFDSRIDGNHDLFKMNLDTREIHRLTTSPLDEFYPQWSPDGSRIVYYAIMDGKRVLHVMGSDGSNARSIARGPYEVQSLDWSPDGKQLLVWSDISLDGSDPGMGHIYTLSNWESPDNQPVWYRVSKESIGAGTQGEWNHDGTQVLFSGSQATIELFDFSEEKRRVYRFKDMELILTSSPRWSEDDKEAYFVASNSKVGMLFRLRLETGAFTLIRKFEKNNQFLYRGETAYCDSIIYLTLAEMSGDIWMLNKDLGD